MCITSREAEGSEYPTSVCLGGREVEAQSWGHGWNDWERREGPVLGESLLFIIISWLFSSSLAFIKFWGKV